MALPQAGQSTARWAVDSCAGPSLQECLTGMLPHPDPEGFRQGGGLPQPKPPWGFGYAAEGAKALPQPLCTQAPVRNGLLSVTFSIFSTCKQAAL